MTTIEPRACATPVCSAWPYPGRASNTTRAPSATAMLADARTRFVDPRICRVDFVERPQGDESVIGWRGYQEILNPCQCWIREGHFPVSIRRDDELRWMGRAENDRITNVGIDQH